MGPSGAITIVGIEGSLLTAAVIFTATYVVVALGRVPGLRLDRTGAAVVGAAFMIAFHVVSAEEAFRMVDVGTIVLLFGMMVVVAHLKLAGFFRWAGVTVARRAPSHRQLPPGLGGGSPPPPPEHAGRWGPRQPLRPRLPPP